MLRFLAPFASFHRQAGACRRRLAGIGVVALALGTAGAAFPRPPHDQDAPGRRQQIDGVDRAEIRRSVGRSGDEMPADGYRERRRLSDAERQSLRQAVRDAYGDPRDQRNRPQR